MRTRRNFRFFALLLLALLLSSFVFSAGADTLKERPVVYTALGDSISTGFRLSDTSKDYVSLFGKYLDTTPANLGVNGLDSAGLLKKLNSDQKMIAQLKKSDVITISMGGNDMLVIFSSLNLDLKTPTSIYNAVKLLQGNSMRQKLESGIQGFRTNWPKIVARLKELSPSAQIVVTTLINPYKGVVIKVPLLLNFDLGAFSDPYIKKINSIIAQNASGSYQIADSYTSFQTSKLSPLTNANLASLDFDPHPNAAGHNLIFQTHEAIKLNFTHDALAIQGPDAIVLAYNSDSASAAYTVRPLMTCFTANGAADTVAYSVADAGATGAVVNSSTGALSVKAPGSVIIKATVTMPQSNLSAEQTKTVKVTKSKPPVKKPQSTAANNGYVPYLLAGLAILLVLAVVAFMVIRRIRATGKSGKK